MTGRGLDQNFTMDEAAEWLWPEQAFALFKAADEIDKEFGLFLRVLCYTGMRLSEALNLRWNDVRLDEGFAYVRQTKTGVPRPVFVPDAALSHLSAHHRKDGGRVFRFTKSGRLYALLRMAKTRAGQAGFLFVSFHTFRHTWATWMRRYGGLDTRGLIGTGAWKDAGSVRRYEHVVATEEAMRASRLPTEEPK